MQTSTSTSLTSCSWNQHCLLSSLVSTATVASVRVSDVVACLIFVIFSLTHIYAYRCHGCWNHGTRNNAVVFARHCNCRAFVPSIHLQSGHQAVALDTANISSLFLLLLTPRWCPQQPPAHKTSSCSQLPSDWPVTSLLKSLFQNFRSCRISGWKNIKEANQGDLLNGWQPSALTHRASNNRRKQLFTLIEAVWCRTKIDLL